MLLVEPDKKPELRGGAMLAHTEHHESAKPSLGDINRHLAAAGFPVIPSDKARGIIPPEHKDRFIRSVYLANQDINCAKFVARVLNNAGIKCPAQDQSHHQKSEEAGSNNDQLTSPEGSLWGDSFHVYGSKSALCFSADTTKGNTPTIALDAASINGPKSYDWKNKIRIQMTKGELPVVASVLLGVRQECEFKNHGQNNDKGFSMKRQEGGKIFVSVFAKGQQVKAVPVFQPDVMWVAALVLTQVQKNCPGIDTLGVITLLKSTQRGMSA